MLFQLGCVDLTYCADMFWHTNFSYGALSKTVMFSCLKYTPDTYSEKIIAAVKIRFTPA